MAPRLVTGLRPTGPLHVGHYAGTLEPLLAAQDRYECFVFIADYHALTTLAAESSRLPHLSRVLAAEFLAAGVDPSRSRIFVQSHVPEHLELAYILSALAPVGALQRTPHYKEKRQEGNPGTLALLGYPVLQAADIAIYGGEAVPVGEDQVPHLELSRELVRKLNRTYHLGLPEPQPILSRVPRLRGLDGQSKMSKSLGNTIDLGASPAETEQRMVQSVTDPQRVTRDIPGRPEVCPVFDHYRAFAPAEAAAACDFECRRALRGCVDCKAEMAAHLNRFLAPLRQRRQELLEDPRPVDQALAEGAAAARATAGRTLAEVKAAMGLNLPGPGRLSPVPITAP